MPATSAQLFTANDYGTFGLPDAQSTRLESESLSSWLNTNYAENIGAGDYSDTAMYREFRTPQDLAAMGVVINAATYRDVYRQEATRLYQIGFNQVHDAKIASVMLETFRRFAMSQPGGNLVGPSPLEVSEDAAKVLTDEAKDFNRQYVSRVAEGIFTQIGEVSKKTGEVIEETTGTVGKVISNPFTPPLLLAGLGVAAFLYFKAR